MAITYKGMTASLGIFGNDLTIQHIFAICNGSASRVNVQVKRIALQNDPVNVLTSVMPDTKVTRAEGTVSGGMNLPKVPFDTSLISDTNVVFRAAVASGNLITATAGAILAYRQLTSRIHTAIGQILGEDENPLPEIVDNIGDEFLVRPGESLLLTVIGAVVASNAAITNNWFINCAWYEDSLTTFAISGTVTLGGNPVDGAKVIVLEADDEALTNAHLVEVKTTNGSGQWSSTILHGKVGAAFVQYVTGGIYYTAPGSPFLED
jgi:hypothetical protein